MIPYTAHIVHEAPSLSRRYSRLWRVRYPRGVTTVEHLKDRRLGRLLKTT
jgi:hypothetical protein